MYVVHCVVFSYKYLTSYQEVGAIGKPHVFSYIYKIWLLEPYPSVVSGLTQFILTKE